MKLQNHQLWFVVACLFEAALLGAAALGRWLPGLPVFGQLTLTWEDAGVGLVGSLPLVCLFLWALRSRRRGLVEIREFLERTVRPIFEKWSLLQIGLISALAGIGEEMLFRGLAQGWLEGVMARPAALIVASVLFGLCHLITPLYGALAAGIGFYLGLMFMVTGNLLGPVLCHATYDFIALVYFLRCRTAPGAK